MQTIPRAEAEMLLAAGKLLKLPPRAGTIRLIEIDDIDLNACGGTHVRATGQIGGLLLRGTERVRQGVRVEFVCGIRASVTARRDLTTLTRAASALSVGRLEVAEAVERLQAEGKAAHKTTQKLNEELAEFQAAVLLQAHPAGSGLRLVRRAFADRDGGFVKLLGSRLVAAGPQVCAMLASTAEDPARVLVAASADCKVNCGSLLRDALAAYGLRGGGSPGMAQGQISHTNLEELFDTIEAGLRHSA
jgi:alanyl-tRNA synthetase